MSLYEEIVGRGGVSPAYFFDSMTFIECAAFLRGMRRKERAEIENTRLIMWAIFQSQSRKNLELDDVMKLWGIERSGFFNGREKWVEGFENQMV